MNDARRALVSPEIRLDGIAEDPDDNRVLEAAVAGEAGYVVLGDRHLLDLGAFQDVQIVTPIRFVRLLSLGDR